MVTPWGVCVCVSSVCVSVGVVVRYSGPLLSRAGSHSANGEAGRGSESIRTHYGLAPPPSSLCCHGHPPSGPLCGTLPPVHWNIHHAPERERGEGPSQLALILINLAPLLTQMLGETLLKRNAWGCTVQGGWRVRGVGVWKGT